MRRRTAGIYVALALSAIALALPGKADALPCFGAPADYIAQFGGDYPEPRAFAESQAWWLEGAGDATTSIDDAMRASHLHYGKCFPFMETWNEASGSLLQQTKLQMHQFVGGRSTSANMFAFQGAGSFNGKVTFDWRPTSVDETRYVQKTRPSSSIVKCGRFEERGHLEGISNNGGERMFNSYGWQSLIACTGSRGSPVAQRGPSIIFRGWYEQANYGNITLVNDFRGEQGFRASQMDDPVVGDLKLSVALAEGANKWILSINPDIHHGSFGSYVVRGTGTSATVTIPNAAIPSGVFRVMVAGCERIGVSSVNPIGGQNCGVGVVPFLGD